MHSLVATTGPARALRHPYIVVLIAQIKCSGRGLLLEVALQAEHLVSLRQQLIIDGTMRVVTSHASLAQCFVWEYKRPPLLDVALEADFVLAHQIRGTAALEH